MNELVNRAKRAQLLAKARQLQGQSAPQAGVTPEAAASDLEAAGLDPSKYAPGTTPQQASSVPPEMVYDPRTGGYVDTALQAQRAPAVSKAAGSAIRGVPFVGEYVDEAIGAVSSQPGMTEQARQMQQQFQEAYPVGSTALQVGTGIATTAPVAVGSGIMQGAGLLQRTAAGLGAGAGLGAAEGAVSGYGAGEGDTRAEEAKQRALVGGVLGGALGAVAPSVGAGLRQVGEWFADRPIKAAAQELGTSLEAARVLKSIADATDEDAANNILRTAGGDTFLADLSPAARGVLDTVMSSHSQAGQIAQDAINTRVAGAGARLATTLDNALGAPKGRGEASAAIRRGSRDVTSAAYDTAYRTPIDYSSPQGQAIEELMGRIPPKKLAAAVEDANDMLRYKGIDADQILIDEAGNRTGLMNVAQLDYLKRAFDKVAREGTDPVTGKLSPNAVFAKQVAGDIRKATRDASPAYAEALSSAADTLGREEALDFGARLLRPQVTRDIASRGLKDMTEPERAAAAQGVREYIDDQLANVTRTLADPNVDTKQVQKLVRDLSSESARKKLVLLLGANGAKEVTQELDRAGIALNLKASTVANSRTFGREVTREAIDSMSEGNPVVQNLLRGNPLATGQELVRAMTGTTDAAINARQQGLYSEIASLLVNIKGDEAARAIRLMRNLDVNKPITKARANTIAKALRPFIVQAQQQSTRSMTEGENGQSR